MEITHADDAEVSDEHLVRLVVKGDVVAFALLYDRYARPIYTLAVHSLGHADAEEVMQDVFLRFWQRAHQFDEQRGSFKSWLMTIARNRVLDELKFRGRNQRLLNAEKIEQHMTQSLDSASDLADGAWQVEQEQLLYRALNRLPAEQRRVIIMAYFGGLSQSSIAEQTGWPLGTVKKRVRLGLKKLRDTFFLRIKPDESAEETPLADEASVVVKRVENDGL